MIRRETPGKIELIVFKILKIFQQKMFPLSRMKVSEMFYGYSTMEQLVDEYEDSRVRQVNVLDTILTLAPPKNSIYAELMETESVKLFKFIFTYMNNNNEIIRIINKY